MVGRPKRIASESGYWGTQDVFLFLVTSILKKPALPIFLFLLLSHAFSVTRTWDNGGGDNLWTTAANWSGDVAPTSVDDVVFNTGSASCFFNAVSTTVASITMTSGYTGRFEWGYAQFGKGIRGQYFSDDAYTGGTFSRVDAQVNFPSDWSASTPSGIGATDIRVIWHGWVVPEFTENYTFYETSDDGGRLWVNGNQIINVWGGSAMVENTSTSTVAMTAGVPMEIKYEMYQGAGAAGAELRWSSPSRAKELIPQSRLYPDRNGLKVQWWQGTDMTGTTGTNAAPFVDFNWGAVGPDDFFTGDDFSGEFQGFIVPQYSETYTFYTSKDDGARLYVNDVLVVDSWNCCGEPSGTIDLVAGVPYYIELEFRDTGGGASLIMSWSSASLTKQVVPVERLYVPYWLNVSGTVDLRSGGVINMGAGELQFIGSAAQTFYPKSGTKLGRLVQNGTGGTTISTNDLTASYLEVRTGTLNLGTGRSVTPDYFKILGGTVNFNTSTLNVSQKLVDFSAVGSATSGAAGSVLAMTNNTGTQMTLTGTLTGTDLDVTVAGTGGTTISGTLSTGAGSITKSGSGTLTVSGAPSNTGTVTVSAGNVYFSRSANTTYSFSSIINNATVYFVPSALAAFAVQSKLSGSGAWYVDGDGTGTFTQSRVLLYGTSTASDNTGTIYAINSAKLWLETSSGYTMVAPSTVIDLAASAGLHLCCTGTRTIGGLTGTGTLNLNYTGGGTPDVAIGGGNVTSSFAGVIQNTSGSLAVTKTGSGTFTLTGASTYTGATTVTGGTLAVASGGSVIGTQSLILNNGGNMTIAGTVTLATDATGVFGVGYGATGTSTLTLNTGGALNVGNGGGRTFVGGGPSGGPYGTGVMTMSGGAFTVAAAGAFPNDKVYIAGYGGTGTVNLNGGTWTCARGVQRGAGPSTLYFNGGTFKAGVTGWYFGSINTFEVRNGGAIFDANGFDFGVGNDLIHSTVGGDNATDGGLTTAGTSGRVFLNGTGNAWTGATTVAASTTLLLDVSGVVPDASPVTVSGTLELDGNSETIGSLAGAGFVDNNSGAGTFTLTAGGNNTSTTFSGILKNTAQTLALTKAGTGTLTLSGANTFTGLTTVGAGTLKLSNAAALGTTAGATTVSSGATLDLNAQAIGAEGLTAAGTGVSAGGALVNSNASAASFAGIVENGAFTVGGTGAITLSGQVGNGSLNLTKIGTHVLTLSGTADNAGLGVIANAGTVMLAKTSSGSVSAIGGDGVTVGGGTVKLSGSGGNQIYDGSPLTVNSGTFDLNGFSELVGIISGAGTIDNTAGAGTFTLSTGGGGGSATFSGVIKNTSQTLALTKVSTGTLTLTGTNTYTGLTTVSDGILKVGGTAALGTTAGGVSVTSGASLDMNGITYSSAEALTLNGAGYAGGGALLNSSTTAATYAGLITLGSATTILASAGNLTLSNAGTITGATFNLTLGGAFNGTLNSIVGTTTGKISKVDAGTWTLTGASTYTGGTEITAGILSIAAENNLGVPATTLLTALGPGTLAVTASFTTAKEFLANGASRGFTFNIAAGQTLTCNGDIRNYTSANSLIKTGTGTLVLAADNDQSDEDILLQAGTLDIRHAGALGNSATADAVYLSAGTTLRMTNNTAMDITASMRVDGTGVNLIVDRTSGGAGVAHTLYNLINNGAYTLNVSAGSNVTSGTAGFGFRNTSTFNGHTVIDVTDPGTPDILATLTGNVTASNYNLTVQGTGNTTITGVLGLGSGTLTKAGAGTLLLSGANTYTGSTTVSAGTLRLDNAAALGTTAAGTSVTSGAAIDMNGINYSTAEALTLNGTGISSGGALMNSSGTGATYAGLLTLGSASSIIGGTGTINISHAGTITGAGLGLTLGGAQGGTLASILGTTTGTLTKQDAGTWSLSGASTFSGGTAVNAGRIYLMAAAGMGTGTATIAAGAHVAIWAPAPLTVANNWVLNGSSGNTSYPSICHDGGAGLVTLNGTINVAAAAEIGLCDASTNAMVINGVISGSGNLTIDEANPGYSNTLTLAGVNTYTGTTTVTTGTLKLGAAGVIPDGTAVTLSGGTLEMNGFSETIGSLAGNGTVDNNAGSGIFTLTAGGDNTSTTFSGILKNTSQTLAFTKAGTGTLTLSGTNTHAGLTTVGAGILKLSNTAALGTTAAGTSVTSGGGLDLNGLNYATAEALTLNGTGAASAGALQNNNASAATWAGLITLGADASMVGAVGTIDVANAGTITGSGFNLGLGGALGGTMASILGTGGGQLNKTDAGTWTLTGTSTRTGSSSATGGTLRVTTTSGLGTGSITVNGATVSFTIDGSGSDGTITLGNDITVNSGYTSTIHVANNGANTGNTIEFDDFNMGVSTLNITGANGYIFKCDKFDLLGGGGGTSVINPTTASAKFTSMTTNAQAHTAQLDGTATGNVINGVMSDAGQVLTVTKANSGTWTLGGANTYTGATTVSSGTLNITGSLASGTAVTVGSGGNLAGTGTMAGSVTVQNGGIVTPGNSGEGTLGTGATVLNSTSVLNYTVGPQGDKIAVTGNLTLDGTLNVSLAADFTFGAYPVMTYTGTLTDNTLSLSSLPSGYYGTLTASGGIVWLNVIDYSGWNYVSTINFNTTSTGANVSGDVTDFPLLVRLDSNNFYFEQAMPDGRDIRFADRDGAPLYHEIERWDASARKAEIWVKVTQVDGNSSQDYINFYWGNATAASTSSGANVFGSYKGVFHLNQSPGGSAPQFTDASGLANHGTSQGGATGDSVTAVAGKGFKLNGSSKYLTTTTAYNDQDILTIGSWFKTVTTTGGKILGWEAAQTGTGGTKDRMVYMGNDGKLNFAIYNGGNRVITSTAAYNDGAWHQVVARVSGSGMDLYVDGASVGTNTETNPEATTGYWRAGYGDHAGWANAPTSNYFNGSLDEVFFSHSSISSDFIKLAYETQRIGTKVASFPNTALSNWAYNSKVYVNTTATGANTAADVANFPMLVRLTSANFDFSQAKADGGDLRFADSSGALLSYEIERFDATNKAAEIWVLMPTVKANNNSQWFRMYWGKGNATTLSSSGSVFSTSNSWAGVWHLKETTGSVLDATTYGNNGSASGNVPNAVDAVVGKGTDFDGNGDYFTPGQGASLDVSSSDKLTLSAWVRRDGAAVAGAWEGIVSKFEWTSGNLRSYFLAYNNATSQVVFMLNSTGASAQDVGLWVNQTLSAGTWYHLAAVADNSTTKVYINGVLQGSQAYSSGIYTASTADARIGVTDDDAGSNRQFWNGVIDEAAVHRIDRSADWIKLSYQNQKSGSTVATLGSRSQDFTSSLRLNFNTTSTGANVTGTDVANIPILVRLTSSNFDFSKAKATGSDIQFIDKDGTYLYHEVVEWDKANSVAKVWVKVPQVDKNSLADFITLYYGCSGCTASPYAVKDSVWSGHAAVFHLAGGESRAFDATKNGYHGDYQTAQPMAAGLTTALAPSFDGANDYIQTTVPTTAGTRTLSAWIYPRSSDDVDFIEPVLDGDVSFQYGTGFGLDNGVFKVLLDNEFWTTSAAVTLNAWQHVALKFNATNAVLYVNGVSAATLSYTQGSISSTTLRIGRSMANALYFDGFLNEVQVMDSYASDDWMKLSYENQKESSLLFSSSTLSTTHFNSSKVFKFNTTSSGANVSGDVYNFPLLLRFTDATLIDATQSAGQDIRFLDGDGVTWLDYQIERWDQANNLGEIWVKIPKLDGNSAGDFITMYYDDRSVTLPDGQCGTCVFGTDNGFRGAWHLSEDGSNTAAAYKDASGQVSHGTGANMTNGSDVASQIGTGSNFTAASSQMITAGSLGMHTNQELTLETWVNSTSQGTYKRILSKAFTSGISPWTEYDLESSGSSSTYAFGLTIGGSSVGVATTTATSNGTWYHIAATYDGTTAKIYHNGVLEGSGPQTGNIADYGRPVTIGGYEFGGSYFDGKLDEPRVHHRARSADWVKLSYETQKSSPSLFNPSPADFVSSKRYVFNTTRTGANVMGDVENFPLLVRITGSTMVDAVQNDYDDIRFLDGDGKTWLDYWVERWSKTYDTADVWVLVPKVDGNSDKDFITLYYDDVTNGAVPNGQQSALVFGSNTNFTGVWHMNDSTNTNVVVEQVGAANGALRNVTTADNTQNHSSAGAIGKGINFMGGTAGVGGGTQQENIIQTLAWPKAAGTVSNWVLPDQAREMVTLYESNGSTASTYNGFTNNSNILETHLSVTSTSYNFTYQDGNSVYVSFNGGGAPSTTAWTHVAATWSRTGTAYLYVNGAMAASADMSSKSWADNAASAQKYFGRTGDGSDTRHFDGKADEVRIADVQRSADWILLDYQTQRPLAENIFWNTRPGPNNTSTLTAAPGDGAISLAWTTPVSDSSNADSVGIWLKYSGKPDSVGATGQTKVVILPKADSAYSYPATYPGTYYFALAVRNTNGKWSPFTSASTDTVLQVGNSGMYDTIYVDSAIGNDANSCATARNPATPKLTLESADDCTATDTLVIRVMPGTYAGSSNETLDPNNGQFIVYTSFDIDSRSVLSGSGTGTHDGAAQSWTVFLYGRGILRNMDIQCSVNGYDGVYLTEALAVVEGCRIYNNGSLKHASGIHLGDDNTLNDVLLANNIIVEPTSYGVFIQTDDRFNIIGNTLVGDGATGTKGIYLDGDANGTTTNTITNNILVNWDYGMHMVDGDNDIGKVDNNLFHLVTSGRETSGETDANKLVKDPLFYTTAIRSPDAYKLLPGSPAIDAGTSSLNTSPWAPAGYIDKDHYGSARTLGSARDIGAYEGTGYTPNPSGEFDTLTNTVSGNTVIVKNSKWKLVWDMARGSGITGFYNMTGDTTANLVATGSLLFDVKLDAYLTSTATTNTLVPSFLERSRARSIVRQRLAVSASIDLNVRYTVYASGHVYVQSEIANLSSGALSNMAVGYGLKLAAADAVTKTAGNLSGISYENGFGFLNTSTRDALLAVTQDLDGNGNFSETWSQTASVAGSLDSVGFSTADLADIAQNMKRHHHFLLYVGDGALDFSKAAALNADAYTPSPVTVSAGSLLHERSWQDALGGHWTFDEGAGTVAKDKSINFTNNSSAVTSAAWVSGKVGGALRFTNASVVQIEDNDALEVRRHSTFMFWFKPDFTAMGSTAGIVAKGAGIGDGWNFKRIAGGNAIRFRVDGATADSPQLTTNTWYHLAGSVGGSGQLHLYLNGVLVGASTSNAAMAVNTSPLRFGENTGANDKYAGDIDDVRIYHTGIPVSQIQAIYRRGFSETYGHYHLRADNNNRVVALLNETTAQTRVQPAFEIDNWFGTKTPKYVYLNGTRLAPNVDFVVDSLVYGGLGYMGSNLVLQLNKVLTGTNQTLFVDDNDSSGFMGEAAKMKSLTMSSTVDDKLVIQNFSDTVFGTAASGQWALELDLDGWTSGSGNPDSAFGEFRSWKAAAVSPSLAVSSATEQVGISWNGRTLVGMKFDNTGSQMWSSGSGYAGPGNIAYTLVDSSSARLSLTLAAMTITGSDGTINLVKRWTVYPTGRIIGSFELTSTNFSLDFPRLNLTGRSNSAVNVFGDAYSAANARAGHFGGDLNFHSFVGGLLSIKSAGATTSAAASMVSSHTAFSSSTAPDDYDRNALYLVTTLFESTDDPITVNFAMDISRNFTDSATADSLMKDLQTPAALTALGGGTANPADGLDFNATPDGFAEGDGAYVFTAASGVAHFKFVNTVTHFNPVFRIKSWTFASLPEYVVVDNQTMTRGYHYNAYVNTTTDELILQFSKRIPPGTHVFFISHKTGLAVTLNHFEAVGGEGVDTLRWSTESEMENLGFHIWRRVAPVQDLPEIAGEMVPGAGIANALIENARAQTAAKAAAAKAAALSAKAGSDTTGEDTLPELKLTPAELKAMGYVRINPKLIPGAKGGSSATTFAYEFIDRSAAFGTTYDYMLEAVDFSGTASQYGPRSAKPLNPMETALYSNYPNPFNPITTLRFSLKEKAKVSLIVYDARGRVVRTLIRPDKALMAGKYRLIWDARDDGGFEAPSGQYFYRFTAPRYHKTRKMILVK